KFGAVGDVVVTGSEDTSSQNQGPINPTTADYGNYISAHKLIEDNYLQWSQSFLVFIGSRGKEGYLTGEIPAPAETDAKYKAWKLNDNLVKTWLLSSMTTSIGDHFLLHKTAKDIWEHAEDTYSNVDNKAEILDIETRLYNLKQGDKSVSEYYNTLCHLWLEIDKYRSPAWSCPADAALYRELVWETRTVRFLLGLNDSLDEARGRVMNKKPLPELRKAFAEIRQETSRRRVMLPGASRINEEVSALAAWGEDAPVCEHCKRIGHVKEKCWFLVGRPANWKPRNKRPGKAHVAEKSEEISSTDSFSKGQIEMLEKMFTKFSTKAGSSSTTSDHQGLVTNGGEYFGEEDWQR
ncbi:hypothetical protein LINPERPRIM_LOCUS5899, partial [Linum perenne]